MKLNSKTIGIGMEKVLRAIQWIVRLYRDGNLQRNERKDDI